MEIETLNLKRVWEILNIISRKQEELNEAEFYYDLLNNFGEYYHDMLFEDFIDYYSFKLYSHALSVYNDNPVAWEDYSRNDFNNIPLELLSMSNEEMYIWIDDRIKELKGTYESDKEMEKANKMGLKSSTYLRLVGLEKVND